MGVQSNRSAVRFSGHCPRPNTFQQSAERGLLLRRMERAVDEIIEGLTSLALTDDSRAAGDALSVGAAARRLADLAARWQRHGGR